MKTLIVNQNEVRQWLPMDECIDVMADVFKMLNRGHVLNPLRQMMWVQEKTGLLGMMPAYLEDFGVMGLKAISFFEANEGTEFDSHQGGVLLFETKNGCLLAMVDASEITAVRTAAVSGVATRLLAREDATTLAIIGSGVQARTHLEAMLLSRKIEQVKVCSLHFDQAEKFASRETEHYKIEIEPVNVVEEAVDGADIICTVTSATDPIVMGDWLKPGVHINAVGSSVPFARELDTNAVVKSRLFVDRKESTVNEGGDFLFPKKEGAIDDDHIQGEIGDILLNKITGRETDNEITLFKSLGLAVEDVASAYHIYKKMKEAKQGLWVDFNMPKQ